MFSDFMTMPVMLMIFTQQCQDSKVWESSVPGNLMPAFLLFLNLCTFLLLRE